MLAELIQELGPQLVRRVEARSIACRAPEHAPSGRPTAQRVPALLQALVRALREGRIDSTPCQGHFRPGLDIEGLLAEVRLLKECVYDLLEERGLAVRAREMRLLSDWFGALAEMALQEENRRFAAMLDALPDHVLLLDVEGRFLYVNRAAADDAYATMGVTRKDLIGRSAFDSKFPESLARQVKVDFARLRDGEAVTSELRFPGPEGDRWHEGRGSPVYASDGSVEAVAIASRDIHDRKVAEARLQLLSKVGTLAEASEYEELLGAVARLSIPELADWCVVDVVEDGKVRRGRVAHGDPVKAALADQLLRYAPDHYERPPGREILAGRSVLVADVSDAKMCDHAGDAELCDLVRQLGARSVMIVPLVVLGTPVAVATFVRTPESGRIHGPADLALAEEMARRAAQIIENARLHQQLRQSEARFRVALAHSNIAVFEEDRDFRIRWMYNSQFGGDAVETFARIPGDVFPAEASAELSALKRRVLLTGEGGRIAVDTLVRGERRHLLLSYEPLRDVGGIVGITGAAVDITEAKKVQEELAQALAFREQMMGVLGHDLRNPLSAVRGLSGLLRLRDDVPENVRQGLERIDEAARRMGEIIETLVDVTRSRFHGSLPIAVELVDLCELSRRVIDELRAAHPGREIGLEANADVSGQWDPARMAQVVSNLVGNALTHGAKETPVQLSLLSDDAQVVLSVTNRGPAIPVELVERLFEPFRQGPGNGDAVRARGLGLGLYIVRQIVVAHDGTIEVRSDDEATVFTVRLPR